MEALTKTPEVDFEVETSPDFDTDENPPLELITVFLPNQQEINVIGGLLTDPATGIQLNVDDVFRV